MARPLDEADWKVWRELRHTAIDRFCQPALQQAAAIASRAEPATDRYLALRELLDDLDGDLDALFGDHRRSTAIVAIDTAVRLGLLSDEDLSLFSEEVRRVLAVAP